MSIYDASVKYRAAGVPLVVLAGKEYGSGSSRDWAAKGTMLLGVKAVIAESFERIHRSNLVNMGVLPLEFAAGAVGRVARAHRPRGVRSRRLGRGARRRAARSRCARARDDGSTRRRSRRRVRVDTPEELDGVPARRHPAVRAAAARARTEARCARCADAADLSRDQGVRRARARLRSLRHRARRAASRARAARRLDRPSGHAGEMTYLARSLDERLDPRRVLPTARSVVSLGVRLQHRRAVLDATAEPGRAVDRALRVGRRLPRRAARAAARARCSGWPTTAGPGFEAFSCVDNGPVQERVFAEQAGLGWIGKNTCLINPTLGSWLFLAEILTNVDLEPDAPGVDQCGTCTRCLDACPTGAHRRAVRRSTRRAACRISRSRRAAPVDRRCGRRFGAQVFGCDICQDVCPWNRRAAASARSGVAAARGRCASPRCSISAG